MSAYQQAREPRWAGAGAQERHNATRARQHEEDRPRPTHEVYQLEGLARGSIGDTSLLVEWSLAATPQTFLLALAAERWDKGHPWYSCVHCHDGKDLPRGYVCEACGGENPGGYS